MCIGEIIGLSICLLFVVMKVDMQMWRFSHQGDCYVHQIIKHLSSLNFLLKGHECYKDHMFLLAVFNDHTY